MSCANVTSLSSPQGQKAQWNLETLVRCHLSGWKEITLDRKVSKWKKGEGVVDFSGLQVQNTPYRNNHFTVELTAATAAEISELLTKEPIGTEGKYTSPIFVVPPKFVRHVVLGFPGVYSGPFGTDTWNIITRIKHWNKARGRWGRGVGRGLMNLFSVSVSLCVSVCLCLCLSLYLCLCLSVCLFLSLSQLRQKHSGERKTWWHPTMLQARTTVAQIRSSSVTDSSVTGWGCVCVN